MLLGHAAAYGLAGRPLIDAHHGWFVFTLENSVAALLAICTLLIACALFYSRPLATRRIETSFLQLWPRMAAVQVILFSCAESIERVHVTVLGIVVQLAAAFCAAYLLSLFSRLLAHCIDASAEASRYFARSFGRAVFSLQRGMAPRGLALFACAGPKSFQRPPPFT